LARDIYRTILEDILPSGTLQLLQTPQHVIATCEFVNSTSQIGTIELPDGNTIALLEVHVADPIKLARNRVALRNFVARFIGEALGKRLGGSKPPFLGSRSWTARA
jgi:hypothetical protein